MRNVTEKELQRRIKMAERNYSHGKSKTRLYHIFLYIKQRCYNYKKREYKNYGGRGITMCNEWKDNFMSFYNWANQNGYREDLTIDRIDVNGNYTPDNCRWITKTEQNKNTRLSNKIIVLNKTYTLNEFCNKYKTSKNTIYSYMKKGLTREASLNKILKEKGVSYVSKIESN